MIPATPLYDPAMSTAETIAAGILASFPQLETRVRNPTADDDIQVQIRNPLNGECWTPVAYIGEHERRAGVLAGKFNHHGQPVFTGTKKEPTFDTQAMTRAAIAIVTATMKAQEKAATTYHLVTTSMEEAKKLSAGLFKKLGKTPLKIRAYDEPNSRFQNDGVSYYLYHEWNAKEPAISISMETVTLTPADAARFLQLAAPALKFLATARNPAEKPPSCASDGLLIN